MLVPELIPIAREAGHRTDTIGRYTDDDGAYQRSDVRMIGTGFPLTGELRRGHRARNGHDALDQRESEIR